MSAVFPLFDTFPELANESFTSPTAFKASYTNDLHVLEEPVIVIIPSGNYNEPRELGRYKSISTAFRIVNALNLLEYRIFSVDSGEELFVQ